MKAISEFWFDWDNAPHSIVSDSWGGECIWPLNTDAHLPPSTLTHKLRSRARRSPLSSPPLPSRRWMLNRASHANRWEEATKATANPFWNYGGEQIKKLQLISWALIHRPSWSNP